MGNKNISLEAIRTIVQEEVRPEIERLDKKITDFSSEILAGQDKILKELRQNSIEQKSMSYGIDENREEIEKHEIRIKALEAHPALA